MSLGSAPRPHAGIQHELLSQVIPWIHATATKFKPGMIRPGQSWKGGRGGKTADLGRWVQRIEADLRYKRDWSLGLDLKIMIKPS